MIHEDAPVTEITLYMESLTAEEREIIKAGSLINFNKTVRCKKRHVNVGRIRHLLSDAMLAHLIRPTNRIEP